jgi:hypothetical protein
MNRYKQVSNDWKKTSLKFRLLVAQRGFSKHIQLLEGPEFMRDVSVICWMISNYSVIIYTDDRHMEFVISKYPHQYVRARKTFKDFDEFVRMVNSFVRQG